MTKHNALTLEHDPAPTGLRFDAPGTGDLVLQRSGVLTDRPAPPKARRVMVTRR